MSRDGGQALGAGTRYKEFKKRPLRAINIRFGEFAMGVQLYAIFKAVRQPFTCSSSHLPAWAKVVGEQMTTG